MNGEHTHCSAFQICFHVMNDMCVYVPTKRLLATIYLITIDLDVLNWLHVYDTSLFSPS